MLYSMSFTEIVLISFVAAVGFFAVVIARFKSKDGKETDGNRAEFYTSDGIYVGYASFMQEGIKEEPYCKIVLRDLEKANVPHGATLTVILDKTPCYQIVWEGTRLKHRKEIALMNGSPKFTRGSRMEIEYDGRVILSGVFGA